MGKNEQNLSLSKIFLIAGVIFSMHFGGSSMIWPMTWGQESGTSVFSAFTGIFLTALLFPLLGYLALSRGKGTFYQVTKRISTKFAKIFCGATMLVLGPLFAIPRMSAAGWDAFLQLTGYKPSNIVPITIFSVIYYLLVYWFISKKDDTVDKISKYLFPVLVLTVITIMVKGLTTNLSAPIRKIYDQPSFVYGFKEGYATVELPCALIYATMIIQDLKNKGLRGKNVNKALAKVGIIGIGLLTLTHLGHMILGANTGTLFSSFKYSSLYTRVVIELLGPIGGAIFNIALMFAALTTAIGLSQSTSDYFVEVNEGKLKYKTCAISILVLSCLVSILGLSSIIKLTGPILDMIYPAAITLTLFYALIPNLTKKTRLFNSFQFAVLTAFFFGIFDGILGYLNMMKIDINTLKTIYNILPLADYGLGWISVTLIGSLIGYFIPIEHMKRKFVSVKAEN